MGQTLLTSFAIAGVVGLLAAACGGGGDDGSGTPVGATGAAGSPASSVTPTPSPTPAATETSTPSPAATTAVTLTPAATPPATPPPSPTATADAGPITAAAREALARWLGPVGDRRSISVVSVTRRNWANGCLELPRPGEACTEAVVEGYRVELGLGRAVYEVRTDATGNSVRWAPSVQALVRVVEVGPNIIVLVPDDGGRIEAQLIPGTQFGIDPSALAEGETVGVGLVEAPQREGLLLIWLDPLER